MCEEGKPGQEEQNVTDFRRVVKWPRKRMAGGGRQRYFSHYSCLVFMVFDSAWSLSP